jgi:hypothetical protein
LRWNQWVLALAPLVLATGAHAGLLYSSGPPDATAGSSYDVTAGRESADDFLFLAVENVTKVAFYFDNGNGITGWNQDLTYEILSDNAGVPGTSLVSGSAQHLVAVDSGLVSCCNPDDAFLVTFDLEAPFTAAAGTRYWLGLGGATGTGGNWLAALDDTTLSGYNGTAGHLTAGDNTGLQFAFSLFDDPLTAAPEPASFVLIGCGLGALGLVRRRFRASRE